jgi:prepilin-type N-terminal cleavage/methylation domain-containing protein
VKRRRPRTGRSRPRAGRGGQRGFTLIELMVALAISTILVMMVLSVFSRMSMAYRRQQQVASLQVILSAGQNMLAQDARQAGFQVANGFRLASAPGVLQLPVRIVNSSTAADEIRFYSADATVQAKLDSGPWPLASVFTVDANQFINGELAVIVNVDTTTGSTAVTTASGSVTRVVPLFRACVVRILSGTANTLTLDTAAPWGDGTNSQCYEVKNAHNAVVGSGQTMFYRFRARAYRLDPTRTALGVLQLSPSGALVANDWQDLGVGFTDLQVAARMFLTSNATDPDLDGRVQYNWFSGAAMQTNTAPFTAATTGANTTFRITRLSLSLVARTDSTVDGVATAATPSFLEVGRVDNNQLGDRAAMDVSADNRIYRYTTNRLDMRNTGAGL